MSKTREILEALKRESNPYDLDTRHKIGREFGTTAYEVGKITREYSLVLDRVIKERKAMAEIQKETEKHHHEELLIQLAAVNDSEETRLCLNWREQEAKEARMLDTAIATVKQITPELLERVGMGPK